LSSGLDIIANALEAELKDQPGIRLEILCGPSASACLTVESDFDVPVRGHTSHSAE